MSERVLHGIAALALCALVAFSVLTYPRRVDVQAGEHYGQDLRTLLALDFRLTAEVMKAHSGVVAHYDGIVQTQAARKRLHRALRAVPAFIAGRGRREIGAELDAAEHAQREEAQLVERFKRENAVLRNSLRFLPVLSGELDRSAAADGQAQLAAITSQLVRDELLLQSWEDEAIVARIDAALAALSAIVSNLQPERREALAMLIAHAELVRARTPTVRALTRKIVAGDGAARTQAVTAAFARHQQRAIETAEDDAHLRFALSLLALVSGAAGIILRMRRSAQRLRRTSAQLERAIASLRAEQEKQKELAELKSRFVAMASHEFRTPLSVIMSSSEMLEAYAERWPAPKKVDHFGRIRSAALGMTRMLDAILMIGRSDAGLLKFNPRPLELDRFCNEVLDAVGDATGQRKRVVYRGPERPVRVLADETLLRHVLENLIGNALKYSRDGTAVELAVEREDAELRFEVRDHGIGISDDDQKHLFESFHRGTNVGGISGTGLGLAIVRGAAELHGGSVAVRSQLGVGTQFTVRVPCGRGEP